jgi:hypothetical protein
MAIPEEIRKVERPVNSVVVDHGGGPLRYAVIERVGCKRINGRNIPIDGRTIGHIVEGSFVAILDEVASRVVELKDYADAVLVDQLSHSLLPELFSVYNVKDAMRIYTMALLKVIYPGAPYCRICQKYDLNWVSELFPELPMSRNSICDFIQDLGKSCSLIAKFMRQRAASIAEDHHILVDGTLKTDNSEVNTLSHYSRKARLKGTKDITVLFAYDVEKREIVCSKVFGGNVLDEVSYESFLEECKVKSGIVMTDKGFPKKQAETAFKGNSKLHWLDPMKRSDKRIEEHHMYDYSGMIDDRNIDVLYKKEKIGNCWLYSFYDRKRAVKEEADYFKHKKGKEYDPEDMKKKDPRFGTIVFESDIDANPAVIYKMYDLRWLIEECFRYYKHAIDLDDTKVHSDYSVIGSEFINFFSSIMTVRLINKFDDCGLFSSMSYASIMSELATAKKARLPESNSWDFVRTTVHTMNTLETLGLITEDKPVAAPRKRGRPKKVVDSNIPKRKPGRPRKNTESQKS